MLRAAKVEKRKLRKLRRCQKRNEKYLRKIRAVSDLGGWVPLSCVDKYGYVHGSWEDSSSPTGYSQKCSYEVWGTCQSPCNGDC